MSHKSLYKTKPLEDALKSAFGSDGLLYGKATPDSSMDIRVAVMSTHAIEKRSVVLSNYNTEGRRDDCEYSCIPCLETR